MVEKRNKQLPSQATTAVREVRSTIQSPTKEQIMEILSADGNSCEYLGLLNDVGLYAEVHKINYNGTQAILKMIGQNSQMGG